jgi:hypothetical protein
MLRVRLLLTLFWGFVMYTACAPGAQTPQRPPGSPWDTATEIVPRRVLVISLDGAQAESTMDHVVAGDMPNLAGLASVGAQADGLQPVEPGLRLPSYVSLSTSTYPADTGFVADRFYAPGKAFPQAAEAAEKLAMLPEPVWRTAMRRGLTAATTFWPSAQSDVPSMQANYMLETIESDAPSRLHEVALTHASGWSNVPAGYAALGEGTLNVTSLDGGILVRLNLLALGNPRSETGLSDLVHIDTDKDLGNGHVSLSRNSWASMTVSPRLHSSADFLFLSSGQDTLTLYQSRVVHLRGKPDILVREINDLGPPPAGPDLEALNSGWLSARRCGEHRPSPTS